MRSEQRKLDRQIRTIQREEDKVKKSIKDAAKRGDTQTCKMMAKEVVRSRKAVNRMHTSKAHMNSVVMQMENQLGAKRCDPRPAHSTTRASRHLLCASWRLRKRTHVCSRCVVSRFAAQQKVTGHMQKSTEVMKMMSKLCKVSEISATMQEMQSEMMKVSSATLPSGAARTRAHVRESALTEARVACTRIFRLE